MTRNVEEKWLGYATGGGRLRATTWPLTWHHAHQSDYHRGWQCPNMGGRGRTKGVALRGWPGPRQDAGGWLQRRSIAVSAATIHAWEPVPSLVSQRHPARHGSLQRQCGIPLLLSGLQGCFSRTHLCLDYNIRERNRPNRTCEQIKSQNIRTICFSRSNFKVNVFNCVPH